MPPEQRFVLADFECLDAAGHRHAYEAERSYPMQPAVAHAAAKRGLVAHHKPPNRMRPSVLTPPAVLTEIVAAASEFDALERHAVEPVTTVG